MKIKATLNKADWEKILTDSNLLIKDCSMSLVVAENAATMARKHIQKFKDAKNNSEEVHSAVAQAKLGS